MNNLRQELLETSESFRTPLNPELRTSATEPTPPNPRRRSTKRQAGGEGRGPGLLGALRLGHRWLELRDSEQVKRMGGAPFFWREGGGGAPGVQGVFMTWVRVRDSQGCLQICILLLGQRSAVYTWLAHTHTHTLSVSLSLSLSFFLCRCRYRRR